MYVCAHKPPKVILMQPFSGKSQTKGWRSDGRLSIINQWLQQLWLGSRWCFDIPSIKEPSLLSACSTNLLVKRKDK